MYLMITMKKPIYIILAFAATFATFSCKTNKEDMIKTDFTFAEQQFTAAIHEIDKMTASNPVSANGEALLYPRSTDTIGNIVLVPTSDWTSGFFPGSLWYLYEYTKDPKWLKEAQRFTAPLEKEKTNTGNHDVGFMMYCSYGNGLRLTNDTTYKNILVQTAYSLSKRFYPKIGTIRSWDFKADVWQCPVIIDNMMNLELLYWAFRETKDSTLYKIATTHAETTMKNHYREDYSTYHVVDYDTITGQPRMKMTHQGYSDSSAWARGQAWSLYGFTMCYRETQKPEFLEQAQHVANYIFTNPNMTADLIPYWDYNAPDIPNAPRDASAATVTASALYELSLYDKENAAKYVGWANTILENLSKSYMAPLDTEKGGFLLLHSVGSLPGKFEIDAPLNYADYYFLEALLRKQKLEQTGNIF